MDIKLIGQGYNLNIGSSVAEELIFLFDSGVYTSFRCLVAFASYGGTTGLSPYILQAKQMGVELSIMVGIDQQGTSKEALEEINSWGVNAFLYYTLSSNIFHPKIYLFENETCFAVIIGSNNLTEMGLVKNIECSVLIKDSKDSSLYNQLTSYWGALLSGKDDNIFKLTSDLIEDLHTSKIILSDKDRAKKYDHYSVDSLVGEKSEMKTHFKCGKMQALPQSFHPKRIVRVNPISNNPVNEPQEWSISGEKNVLIAEIGKGSRWKQVNFPIVIFRDFFGAEAGDNTYKISLINITTDGETREVEERQAVTVASQNYRFEIGCTETKSGYPSGDKRPIAIFIKMSDRRFLYHLLMPNYDNYSCVYSFLYQKYSGAKRELKRYVTDIDELKVTCPLLPFQ